MKSNWFELVISVWNIVCGLSIMFHGTRSLVWYIVGAFFVCYGVLSCIAWTMKIVYENRRSV